MVAKLRDEFVAGRLSHDTFLHRVNLVFESRRQDDLPPFVADLPAGPSPGGKLVGWLRGTWARLAGTAAGGAASGPGRDAAPRAAPLQRPPDRLMTTSTSLSTAPGARPPFALQFPRAAGDRFTIGRDASCDLAIADMSVSRQHAQLERTQDGWMLSDLESTNGTRVNGWRVRGQVPVKVGDVVTFGSLEVIFERAFLPPGE